MNRDLQCVRGELQHPVQASTQAHSSKHPHELARDESAFGLQLSGLRRCGGRRADSDSAGRTVVRAADHEGRDLYAVERLPHELELGRLRVQRAAAAAPTLTLTGRYSRQVFPAPRALS